MRLVWYEWKKLWKNASILKIALIFFTMSGILFWGELNQEKEWISEYLELYDVLAEKEKEDASAWLAQRKDAQEEESHGQWKAFEQIEREVEALNGYESYRASIQRQYQENQEISIFSESNSSQGSYRKKIADTYEKLQIKAPMMLQPYLGLERLLDFYAGDVLAVIFLIYLSGVLFLQEEKTGKSDFAVTMLYGNTHLFLAKTLVVFLSLAAYLLFSFFLNFILETALLCPISFSAAIQSVPGYYAVPYAWSIGAYLFVCAALKILAAAILAAVAVAAAKRFGSGILTAVFASGILGFGIWRQDLYGSGLKDAARIWNVWSLLRGKPLIGGYERIRFGGWSIETTWGLLPAIALAVSLILFAKSGGQRERRKKIKRSSGRKKRPRTIFYYEMKKMWIHQKGILFFAVCMILYGMTVWRHHDFLGTEEYYYQQYIDRFGDRITEQTGNYIAEEEAYFEQLEKALAGEENMYRAGVLQKQLERRMGLEKYINRMELLKRGGKEEILLKDAQYNLLFGFTETSRMMVLLLCASFAFLIPAVFQKEKETGVEILQKVTVCGGKKLWNAKTASLLIYAVPLILAFQMISFGWTAAKYDVKLFAPVDCLTAYWNTGMKLPVAAFFILGILLQCISASAVLFLLSACAKRVKNQYLMTGIVLGGTVAPTLLSPFLSVWWLRVFHDFFFVFTYQSRWMLAGFILIAAAAAAVVRKETICRKKTLLK